MNPLLLTTASQILIPVLFLALVLLMRGRPGAAGAELFLVGVAVLFLVAGEASALHAIGAEETTAVRQRIVEIALMVGTLAVFALIAIPRVQQVEWLRGQRLLGTVLLLGYGAALLCVVVVISA